jgi:exopolysaccharide biosynthesis WecB/TagA/CpsF family protein
MSTRCDIAGFLIRRTKTNVVVRFLNNRLRCRRQTIVLFANANFVNRCGHLRQAISESSSLLVLNDGIALDVASFVRFGTPFPENMNGTDFTGKLLSGLDQEATIFLLGAHPNVIESAARVFDRFSRVRVVGYADGYSIWEDEDAIIQEIQNTAPDILLVGFGNPLQEEWILRNRAIICAPLILAVGALFDFISGNKPRAPKALRMMRLEWAHRLALEPSRLVYRYTIGTARFFAAVLIESDKSVMR